MIAGDALGALACRGHLRHRQRGRVGGEHAVLGDDPLELREQRSFCGEVLDDRLDDHLAGREALELVDHLDAAERRVDIARLQAAFLGELAEGAGDRLLALLRRAGLRVEQQRARAALRQDLRDAAAHRAGTGDTGKQIGAAKVEQ